MTKMKRPLTLKEHHDAFHAQRNDLYQSITNLATIASVTLLFTWVYLAMLILDKLFALV